MNALKFPIFIARRSPFIPMFISGIAMGFTVAPFEWWMFAWLALVPLWIGICQSPRSRFQFFFLALIWGIGYNGVALFWITGIHPMTWMGVPWLPSLAIALFCWIFITLWGAALVGVWGFLLGWIQHRLRSAQFKSLTPLIRVIIGTALWCLLEAIWSSSPLWWPALAYTQSPHNLAILQLGKLSGPNTVTAAIVAVNGLFAQAGISVFDRRLEKPNYPIFSRYLTSAILLFFTLHLCGFYLYSRPFERLPNTTLKVGIIQGNIPNEIKLYPGGIEKALEGYVRGYEGLADTGVEVILTPETALPVLWTQAKLLDRKTAVGHFYQAILDRGVPIWVGTFGLSNRDFTNSLVSVNNRGETVSRYDKIKLVPLGEYIPFERILGKFIDRLSPLDARLIPGKPNQIFETPFGRAIVGICYESAFSEHFRRQAAAGGEFLLSASNNAHYAESMPAQHHAQDVMRAIETDRWAVRATNTGYSAIVDPHGRTIWKSGIKTYETHADTINRRQTRTLYVRWGDWLTPLLLALAAIGFFGSHYWH
ncbi:MAG: apolipoprotein N-acyltransferase [Geitlerinemataceae cyanobacterium]